MRCHGCRGLGHGHNGDWLIYTNCVHIASCTPGSARAATLVISDTSILALSGDMAPSLSTWDLLGFSRGQCCVCIDLP